MAECQRRRHKRVVEGAGRYDWSPAVGAARHSGRPRVMPPPPNNVRTRKGMSRAWRRARNSAEPSIGSSSRTMTPSMSISHERVSCTDMTAAYVPGDRLSPAVQGWAGLAVPGRGRTSTGRRSTRTSPLPARTTGRLGGGRRRRARWRGGRASCSNSSDDHRSGTAAAHPVAPPASEAGHLQPPRARARPKR